MPTTIIGTPAGRGDDSSTLPGREEDRPGTTMLDHFRRSDGGAYDEAPRLPDRGASKKAEP